VPVVALDRLFALRETPRGLYTPLLLLDSRAGPLALLVDRVTELAQVPAESLAPVGSGAALNDCAAAEVRWKGVVGHLLSLERLLLVQEQRRLDELRLQEQNRLAVLEESA
jgi:purine-binding chemotaxis protein CheW